MALAIVTSRNGVSLSATIPRPRFFRDCVEANTPHRICLSMIAAMKYVRTLTSISVTNTGRVPMVSGIADRTEPMAVPTLETTRSMAL